ncbi:MAG: putative toxin-antitoxin system toxin component, PIN family [Prevotellaceae bacterium]|jgi:putative PIN family toxin of toxin-antitoxin system|nr:putative toxin-antitoxin system toxin component, PIN family [Prevotellaceae bacterium]
MKLVLDTNIFISAFFWGGTPQKIIERVNSGIDFLYVTDGILTEIAQVLARPKFNVDKTIITRLINAIREVSVCFAIDGAVRGVCRDEKDDMILECGWRCNADYIITGDNDVLSLKNFRGVKIVKASDYLHAITLS